MSKSLLSRIALEEDGLSFEEAFLKIEQLEDLKSRIEKSKGITRGMAMEADAIFGGNEYVSKFDSPEDGIALEEISAGLLGVIIGVIVGILTWFARKIFNTSGGGGGSPDVFVDIKYTDPAPAIKKKFDRFHKEFKIDSDIRKVIGEINEELRKKPIFRNRYALILEDSGSIAEYSKILGKVPELGRYMKILAPLVRGVLDYVKSDDHEGVIRIVESNDYLKSMIDSNKNDNVMWNTFGEINDFRIKLEEVVQRASSNGPPEDAYTIKPPTGDGIVKYVQRSTHQILPIAAKLEHLYVNDKSIGKEMEEIEGVDKFVNYYEDLQSKAGNGELIANETILKSNKYVLTILRDLKKCVDYYISLKSIGVNLVHISLLLVKLRDDVTGHYIVKIVRANLDDSEKKNLDELIKLNKERRDILDKEVKEFEETYRDILHPKV